MFADIIGHEGPLRVLKRAVFTGHLPNAYLFVGPPHVGRRTIALQLAKTLNCQQRHSFVSPEEVDCCEACENCRAINREQYPDLMIVRPRVSLKGDEEFRGRKETTETASPQNEGTEETEEGPPEFVEIAGAMIRVEQIEALIEHAHLKRVRGRYKVYILVSAETMNPEAQNRLLKILEEPPPYTLFILTTANLNALLPTTKSRCSILSFDPVSSDLIRAGLARRFPEDRLARLLPLAQGRVGWLLRMLEKEEILSLRERLLDLCAMLPDMAMIQCLREGEQLLAIAADWWRTCVPERIGERALQIRRDRVLRTVLPEILDLFISWFRDLLVAQADPDSPYLVNADRRQQLQHLAPLYQAERCRNVCLYLEEIKKHLRQNVNLRLASEIIMLRMITAR